MKCLLLGLCILWMHGQILIAQNRYFYKGTGDLTSLASWGTDSTGSGNAPGSFNNAGDTFEIRNCSSLMLSNTWNVSGMNSRVMIGDGIQPITFIISSSVSFTAVIILKPQAVLLIGNAAPPAIDSLYPRSKVVYNSNGNQVLSSHVYAVLEINGSGNKTATGDLQITDSLILNGTLDLNATSEDLSGNFVVTGTGLLRTTSSGSAPLPSGLTWSCTVEFYRSGVQTVSTGAYRHLLISGNTGTKTVNGILAVDSNLLIAGGSTLAMGPNPLTSAHLNPYGFGTLSTTSSSTAPIPENMTWPFAVTYSSSTSGQTIVAGIYQILNITSGSNTNISSGNIHLLDNGTLQVSSGNSLDMLSGLLTFGTGVSIGGAGIIRTQHTGNEPLPANQTWTQSVFYNSSASQHIVPGSYQSLNVNGGERYYPDSGVVSISGTFTATTNTTHHPGQIAVRFIGAGNQTISVMQGFPFRNLTCATGGIKSFSNSISVSGLLTIDSAVTLNLGLWTLSGSGLTTVGTPNSILRTQNTSSVPLPSQKIWNMRVQFDGNNQAIPAGQYNGGLTCSGGMKTMSGNISVGDTLLIMNTSLAISANELTLYGIFSPNQTGYITGSLQSKMVIAENSCDAGMLWMNQASKDNRSLNSLTLNRTSGNDALVLGSELRIAGFLNLMNGTFMTNGNLIFTSDSTSTGQLAPVSGTGFLNGTVGVEQFLQSHPLASGNRWHFLSCAVSTSGFISNNWQQQLHITGNGSGGSNCPNLSPHSNGFDPTSSNHPSFYTWNKITQHWDSLPSTNAARLELGKGYRVFYRGKRSRGCELLTNPSAEPDDTSLYASGQVAIGDFTIAGAQDSGGYELIGNPYQCVIDWASPDIDKYHLSPAIFSWKDGASSTGSYASYTAYPVPDSTNGMSRFIHPGTSFFIQTSLEKNGSLTFRETCKSMRDPINSIINSPGNKDQLFKIQLLETEKRQVIDEVLVRILPGSKQEFLPEEDIAIPSFVNTPISLCIAGDTHSYSICRVPSLPEKLTIHLSLFNLIKKNNLAIRLCNSEWLTDSLEIVVQKGSFLNEPKWISIKNQEFIPVNPEDSVVTIQFLSAKSHATSVYSNENADKKLNDYLFRFDEANQQIRLHALAFRTDGISAIGTDGRRYQLDWKEVGNNQWQASTNELKAGIYFLVAGSLGAVFTFRILH